MRSQNARLVELMGSMWVTPADALQATQCMRLAARVQEIRANGVQVVDRWETTPTGKRVKAYRVASSIQVPH